MEEYKPSERALPIAEEFLERLRGYSKQIQLAGSLRRKESVVKEIDIITISHYRFDLKEFLSKWCEIDPKTQSEWLIRCKYEDLWFNVAKSDEKAWGASLLRFTGNWLFNIAMNQHAKTLQMFLTRSGLFKLNGTYLAGENEVDVFRTLGLRYVEPWKRKDSSSLILSKDDEIYRIPSSSGIGMYDVMRIENSWTCTCPGFYYRHECKHIQAVREGLRK